MLMVYTIINECVNDQHSGQGSHMTLEEIFDEAMDEIIARSPRDKDQLEDVAKEILDNYNLSSAEQDLVLMHILNNYNF